LLFTCYIKSTKTDGLLIGTQTACSRMLNV
jgi:hypothetical protein